MAIDRRMFVRQLLIGTGIMYIFPQQVFAAGTCEVTHPLTPPNPDLPGVCHNCGMMRPMWARTWHTYQHEGQKLEVCSMHCLTESTMNSGTMPTDAQVALYLDPKTMVAAEQASYVVGSKAPGTMTMTSKLAFASRQEAEAFAGECGGAVLSFTGAYQAASATIAKENQMINANRISKGKIVEPVDNKDTCAVCGMYPARYPKHKAQLQTADGQVKHFCGTQCLFEYLNNSQKYGVPALKTKFVWVVDFESGQWIYAMNAFYVLGTTVNGPMGKEALAFVNKGNAGKFATANKGKVLRFKEVTIQKIMS